MVWFRTGINGSELLNFLVKQIGKIICKLCYMIWFSPEMISPPVTAFQLQVIITITRSNFS